VVVWYTALEFHIFTIWLKIVLGSLVMHRALTDHLTANLPFITDACNRLGAIKRLLEQVTAQFDAYTAMVQRLENGEVDPGNVDVSTLARTAAPWWSAAVR